MMGSTFKKSVLLLFSVLYIAACNGSDAEIGKFHVGDILIGASSDSIKHKYQERVVETTVNREGDQYPALSIALKSPHAIILELDDSGNVWAIRIEDPVFKTKAKVGVGSSFGEVKEAYPNSTLNLGLEDGGYVSLYVPSLNGFFSFDFSKVNLDKLVESSTKSNELNDLRTNVILLHGESAR